MKEIKPYLVKQDDERLQHIKQDAFSIYNWIDQKGRAIKGTDLLPPVFVTGGLHTAIRQMAEGILEHLKEIESDGGMII